jgi:hypothetical protein
MISNKVSVFDWLRVRETKTGRGLLSVCVCVSCDHVACGHGCHLNRRLACALLAQATALVTLCTGPVESGMWMPTTRQEILVVLIMFP